MGAFEGRFVSQSKKNVGQLIIYKIAENSCAVRQAPSSEKNLRKQSAPQKSLKTILEDEQYYRSWVTIEKTNVTY